MKKQVFNPFLPINEYIPDGEPHVSVTEYIFTVHMTERAAIPSAWTTMLCTQPLLTTLQTGALRA